MGCVVQAAVAVYKDVMREVRVAVCKDAMIETMQHTFNAWCRRCGRVPVAVAISRMSYRGCVDVCVVLELGVTV